MKRICVVLIIGAVLPAVAVGAQVTFEMICEGYGTSVSADGSAVAGNTQQDYEPFRWTEETGRVLLGRASVPVLGTSAGIPGISADGTRVSSTILGEDSTYITMGIWTLGLGWQEAVPPVPPDGGLMDNSYGSAWGLSGDGSTLVGLYWRPGQPNGLAHACSWSESTGVVDLGSSGGDSRANGACYDASVVSGWSADPVTGGWRPAAWVNGSLSILGPPDHLGEAWAVTPGGAIVVGSQFADSPAVRTAAMWHWDGSGWGGTRYLGILPGTAPPNGTAVAHGVSADGSVVVGYNSFYGDPFYTTGFIWTQETGMVDVEDFLADNGIDIPAGFDIRSLTAITPDGTTIVGDGQDTAYPYTARTFVIRVSPDALVPRGSETPDEQVEKPELCVLANPARGSTRLALSLPAASHVDLEVYDITGRLVSRLLSGKVTAGRHHMSWDGRDTLGRRVAPGAYIVRFNTPDRSESKKVVLIE